MCGKAWWRSFRTVSCSPEKALPTKGNVRHAFLAPLGILQLIQQLEVAWDAACSHVWWAGSVSAARSWCRPCPLQWTNSAGWAARNRGLQGGQVPTCARGLLFEAVLGLWGLLLGHVGARLTTPVEACPVLCHGRQGCSRKGLRAVHQEGGVKVLLALAPDSPRFSRFQHSPCRLPQPRDALAFIGLAFHGIEHLARMWGGFRKPWARQARGWALASAETGTSLQLAPKYSMSRRRFNLARYRSIAVYAPWRGAGRRSVRAGAVPSPASFVAAAACRLGGCQGSRFMSWRGGSGAAYSCDAHNSSPTHYTNANPSTQL